MGQWASPVGSIVHGLTGASSMEAVRKAGKCHNYPTFLGACGGTKVCGQRMGSWWGKPHQTSVSWCLGPGVETQSSHGGHVPRLQGINTNTTHSFVQHIFIGHLKFVSHYSRHLRYFRERNGQIPCSP